jgi:hypothetical protein
LIPKIHLSSSALVLSGGVRDGSKNPARLPSISARRIHAATEYASCWSEVRPSHSKLLLHRDGLKVIEEGRPIRKQVISFEIPQRKRKGMVDADVSLKDWNEHFDKGRLPDNLSLQLIFVNFPQARMT